jgi:hypothetical protein
MIVTTEMVSALKKRETKGKLGIDSKFILEAANQN